MKSFWSNTILVGFITTSGFWMPFVPAAEIKHVHLGSTVILTCNISYLRDTTWLKQNPNHIPTVVLCASLEVDKPVQVFQHNPRFSVELMNRSLALTITDIEETDLGLYYCAANVKKCLTVGRGTLLQVSSPSSSSFLVNHWYCITVVIGLLIMMLAVCIITWRAKSNRGTGNISSKYSYINSISSR